MTDIKPELSNKSKWKISKHKYYELKHFCLQFDEWIEKVNEAALIKTKSYYILDHSNDHSDPTYTANTKTEQYKHYISLIKDAARFADPELQDYILKAVTKGLTYNALALKYEMPCCRDVYYDRYRKFFWILDQLRENTARG